MDGYTYALLAEMDRKLDLLLALNGAIKSQGERMSAELDHLAAQVKQNTDAEQSAVTLLGQLSGLIRNSVNDPAALTKLASDLDASKTALAAAVVANTPAAPAGGTTPPGPPPAQQSRR